MYTKTKVALLPVVPQEKWISINNYYKGLRAFHNKKNIDFQVQPNFLQISFFGFNKIIKFINKYIIYPLVYI